VLVDEDNGRRRKILAKADSLREYVKCPVCGVKTATMYVQDGDGFKGCPACWVKERRNAEEE